MSAPETVRWLPAWVDAARAGVVALVLAVLFVLSPVFLDPPGVAFVFLEVVVLFLIYALVVVGLNLQYGHAGLVNFGPVAFFAVGGYATAVLTADDPFGAVGFGLPWYVGLASGVVVAVALGVLVGVSSLRLRDDFLAIVTLAVAEIVHALIVAFRDVTGGSVGLPNVPRPIADHTGGSGTAALASTILVFGAVVLLAYGVFRRISTAPYGRVLRAIRADEQVTQTLGKRTFRYKLMAFIYGSALAGLGGGLLVLYFGSASADFFTINVTVIVWIGMLIGGAGNDRGVLAGLAVIMGFQLLTRFLNQELPLITQDQFASLRFVFVGLLLMLIIRYRPQGLWGDAKRLGIDQ
ncbi:MAG: branched-chain amino acid ABC transporter permease [Halobacteriales archaeon]